MKEKKLLWISGTIVALAGVGLARLLAPEFSGFFNKIALVSGYLLSLAGIVILAYACRPAKPKP